MHRQNEEIIEAFWKTLTVDNIHISIIALHLNNKCRSLY